MYDQQILIETAHDKTYNKTCVCDQQILTETAHDKTYNKTCVTNKYSYRQRITKPTIRPVWPTNTHRVFVGHTGLIVGFVMRWLILYPLVWPSLNAQSKLFFNTNKWAVSSGNVLADMCIQLRFRLACKFAQPDQNIHWAHLRQSKMRRFFVRKTKTDQTA